MQLSSSALQAAQPALLYIVPAVLGAVAVHAQLRSEFLQVGCSMCILKHYAGESADAAAVEMHMQEMCVPSCAFPRCRCGPSCETQC